jgi:hypothetical protein
MRLLTVSLACAVIAGAANTAATKQATFNKDVLPVLQKNCQNCHRPGEVAPMSFLTYQDARPWAKAIKGAVLTKKMPPWFADAKYGHFANELRLTDAEINMLANWADNGAPEGDAKDKPAPVKFYEGWNIRPDVVLEMSKAYEIPASGTVEYTYVVIPTGFTKDTWVTASEVRPGNRKVVHHVIAFVRPAGSGFMKNLKPGEFFVPRAPERDENGAEIRKAPREGQRANNAGGGNAGAEGFGDFLAGYAPGLEAQRYDLAVPGTAKLVPAGADVILQLHYTTNGKPATDLTKVGLTITDQAPKYRYVTANAATQALEIPPNEANYESHSSTTFKEPAQLVWLMPHMHVRGKDFIYKAVYPTGETETLLNVPHFDFNWQLGYDVAKPLLMPKGTRIECTAHHDNSANNKYNPNPNATVRWGDQTWEEMMIGWFAVVVENGVKPQEIFERPARAQRAGSE